MLLTYVPAYAACIECIHSLSDVEHIGRVKSSARLALKGIVAKITVITYVDL